MYKWYYRFQDGYECWTIGKMDRVALSWEVRRHGIIKEERRA